MDESRAGLRRIGWRSRPGYFRVPRLTRLSDFTRAGITDRLSERWRRQFPSAMRHGSRCAESRLSPIDSTSAAVVPGPLLTAVRRGAGPPSGEVYHSRIRANNVRVWTSINNNDDEMRRGGGWLHLRGINVNELAPWTRRVIHAALATTTFADAASITCWGPSMPGHPKPAPYDELVRISAELGSLTHRLAFLYTRIPYSKDYQRAQYHLVAAAESIARIRAEVKKG